MLLNVLIYFFFNFITHSFQYSPLQCIHLCLLPIYENVMSVKNRIGSMIKVSGKGDHMEMMLAWGVRVGESRLLMKSTERCTWVGFSWSDFSKPFIYSSFFTWTLEFHHLNQFQFQANVFQEEMADTCIE